LHTDLTGAASGLSKFSRINRFLSFHCLICCSTREATTSLTFTEIISTLGGKTSIDMIEDEIKKREQRDVLEW
jgi:hypothetical protein